MATSKEARGHLIGMSRILDQLPVWFMISSAMLLLVVSIGGIFFFHNTSLAISLETKSVFIFIMIALAALGCEFIDSGLGMGYGTTLTPLLLLAGYEPLDVVLAILISELATGILAAIFHDRAGNMDIIRDSRVRKTSFILALFSVLGATLAVFTALNISKQFLGTAIGVIITVMGILILSAHSCSFKFTTGRIIVLGIVAAFNKGLSGGGYGPLVTGGQIICGIKPKQAVGITSLAEAATCLVALSVYLFSGRTPCWSLVAPLFIGGVISVPFSVLTIKRITANKVRIAIGVGTLVLGLFSLVKIWS